jgi:hypothetical protein
MESKEQAPARREEASIHYRTSRDMKERLFSTAAAQGCSANSIMDKVLSDYLDKVNSSAPKLDPLEVRRRQVVKDLEDTDGKLTALRKKLDKPEAKERRLGIIARNLMLTYPKLNGNWKLIRLRALDDFLHKPGWAKQLNIKGRLDISLACDQAQTTTDLMKAKKDLEREDEVLNRKMAMGTVEDASSAAQRTNQESSSSPVRIPEVWPYFSYGEVTHGK